MAVQASRLAKIRQSLTRGEWFRLGGFYSIVALLHIIGFGVLIVFVLPSHFKALGIGVGLTAYGFGLRHAFDADHISAIDNTTRKLLADGKRPLGVGFFFSLGHSTIVFGLALGLTFAARAVAGQLGGNSQLKSVGGYIGTGVSGFFLYLIAAINLVILVGIVRIFREMRTGVYDEATLEEKLNQRGLMNRLLGPLARSIRSSWQMYPVGVLFGLGFDTATEVGFLALAGGAAAGGLPWYATLCLPVLFAAGMCLMDTTDGAFMNVAYGWAFSKPVRKVFYNLAITGLSVAVALIVGTVELLSILANYFNLSGGVWTVIGKVDLNTVGFIIVGMFVATWVGAVAIWRFGRIEQRWALAPQMAEGSAEIRATAAARERLERDTLGRASK
jgi:high-affinity nickel-transport protein